MAYNSISIKPYIKSHVELQKEITLIELAPSPYFFVLSICLAYMNMFARFDENPAMTLQDIKETKHYGRTDKSRHGQHENSIPTTNKVCRGGGGGGGGGGIKIFQYCTGPAGQVTYNFHSSCKHMHLSFRSICIKEHKGVIRNKIALSNSSQSTHPTGRVLGKNYSSFLDFTRISKRTSGILAP